MSKRRATVGWNHENWDKDIKENSELQQCLQASQEVIDKRTILKARRRCIIEDNEDSNIFKGFTGLTKKQSSSNMDSFNFSKTLKSELIDKSDHVLFPKNNSGSNIDSPKSSQQSDKFLHMLKLLNESLLQWIKKHLDENPYCDLTPVFKDYDRHLTQLENSSQMEINKVDNAQFSKNDTTQILNQKNKQPSSVITDFCDVTKQNDFYGFQANKTKENKTVSSGDEEDENGHNQQKPLNSNILSQSSANLECENKTDDEIEEEKLSVTHEIEEADAIYSQRCKLYYKKEQQFLPKGTGVLHLKKMESEKIQLLMRANTATGNILLNIMLQSSIPVQLKENNVIIICVPNPPINPDDDQTKAIPLLFKVKTYDDAKQLAYKLEKYKK